jgi:hypothetical protein
MAYFVDVKHDTGIAYGDGYAQGDAECGSVMKIVGNDLFAVADDPTEPAFGILFKDVKAATCRPSTPRAACTTDNLPGRLRPTTFKGSSRHHNLTADSPKANAPLPRPSRPDGGRAQVPAAGFRSAHGSTCD